MIYTMENRPIKGFPVVHYYNNSVWGGSKPTKNKEVDMLHFLGFLMDMYENTIEGNPICFETELIDLPEDNDARFRLDQVLRYTLQIDFPELKIGVFDQSGDIGFKRFHPDNPRHDRTKLDFQDVQSIGNTYFGPFYLNQNRMNKVDKKGIEWFNAVLWGRRQVVMSGGYDNYIMSINHTTIGAYTDDAELTVEMQRDFYVGDEAWYELCIGGGGDVMVWTHHQQKEMLPEAREIMLKVQEETK